MVILVKSAVIIPIKLGMIFLELATVIAIQRVLVLIQFFIEFVLGCVLLFLFVLKWQPQQKVYQQYK